MAMPRAWPSFRVLVDEGRLDRRLLRGKLLHHPREPVVQFHEARGERGLVAGGDRAAGNVDQPVAVDVDQAPAGAAEPGIDTDDANRAAHLVPLIDRPGRTA
jgi:hypothetical protein